MYAIWSRWAPPDERAALATIPHAGTYAGSVAGTLLAGYLCETVGWHWVFYIFGIFALMWVAVWMVMVSDSPDTDLHISEFERKYIQESLKDDHTEVQLSFQNTADWKPSLESNLHLTRLPGHSGGTHV